MKTYVPQLPQLRQQLGRTWDGADAGGSRTGCSDKLVDAIVAWGTEKQIQDSHRGRI